MKIKQKVLISTILLLTISLLGFFIYQKIFESNIEENAIIYIKTGANFENVLEELSPYLKDLDSFKILAQKMKYTKIKPGRYEIDPKMSNIELVRLLRAGIQKPIKLSFNNQDYLEKLAGRISNQIEADSASLLEVFRDQSFLEENGFNINTALCVYIPNTYEFYWNTNAEKFREKMLKSYKTFWNEERVSKAKKQNLTTIEVIILASIVQKETSRVSERKTVAGLYLNRLSNKMLLQADPTVIYSQRLLKGIDYEIKRVLLKDLEIDSPYNTYKYEGLPPGPISMPDISSIEAVLNPEKHEYLYMCASVTDFGGHAFARTLSQHNVNAAKYQKWVREQGY